MLKLNIRLKWTSMVMIVNLINCQLKFVAEAKAAPGGVFFSSGESSYRYEIPEANSNEPYDADYRDIEEESGFGPRISYRPAYGFPPPRPHFFVSPPTEPPWFEDKFIETISEEEYDHSEYNPLPPPPPDRPFYSKPTFGGFAMPSSRNYFSFFTSHGAHTVTTTPRPLHGYSPIPTIYGPPSAPNYHPPGQFQTGYHVTQHSYVQPQPTPASQDYYGRNSYYQPQPQNSYGQIQPQNSYGQIQPQNSYGQIQPQNSYGQIQPQNSYGQIQPQNTYQQPQNSYQHPQNTYQQPQNSYQHPQNSYYQPQPQNPYGQTQSQSSYGQSQSTQSYETFYGQARKPSYAQSQVTATPQNIYGQSAPSLAQNQTSFSWPILQTGGHDVVGSTYVNQKLTNELEMYRRLVAVLYTATHTKNIDTASTFRTSFGTPSGQSLYKPSKPMILPRPISPLVSLNKRQRTPTTFPPNRNNVYTQGVTTTLVPRRLYNDNGIRTTSQVEPLVPPRPFFTRGPYDEELDDRSDEEVDDGSDEELNNRSDSNSDENISKSFY